jgi:amino acid permease
MYIHFGLIYYSDPNHIINGVSWTTINISISLFIIATFLYRHALHDCQIQSDFMMLLPEILILLSMAFVFFQYIITAFLLLAVGKLYMAFTVIVINSYKLWSLSSTAEDNFDVEQDQGSKDNDSIV